MATITYNYYDNETHDNVVENVKRYLREECIPKCNYIYVGRTNNPEQRLSEHQRKFDSDEQWHEMNVVYGNRYLGNSVKMENSLIEYVQRNRFDNVRWNTKGTQWSGPQNFSVYLLLDRAGQRKPMPNTTPYEASDLLKGRYNAIMESALIDKVNHYIKRQNRFYIGLTNDSWRRFGEHQRKWEPAWDELLVIYQTSSLDNAAKAESMLIEHFKNHANNKNGPKGMMPSDVEPYFYVYFLLDKKRKFRS